MRKYLLLLTLLLSLAACNGDKQILRGSGVEVLPHPAAVKLCVDQPQLEICKPGAE